ncbi:inositol polyphosphate kinase-domain-containing protein [Aspergillus heterothallicus]
MPSSSRSDSLKNQKLDNDSFVAFDHAAAGHDGVRCTTSGSLIAKPCTAQEIAFYESTALHPAFREFIPFYVGTLSTTDQDQPSISLAATTAAHPAAPASSSSVDATWTPSGGKKLDTGLSIVLENVASGFKRPNVLDIKLGARLWADDAIPAKRVKLDAVSNETTSSSLGFRIAGMKVWTGENGEADEGSKTNPYITRYEKSDGEKGEVTERDGYKRYDKWYGRSFTKENVKGGLETFLAGAKMGGEDRSKLIAKRLADGLKHVQEILESEESRMYSGSVLIIYEGDPEAMGHALEEEKKAEAAPKAPAQDFEEDDEDEEEGEGLGGLEIGEGVPFDIAGLPVGENGISNQTFSVTIDPETAQLGNLEDEDEEEEEEDAPKVHDLRLIDFAHASWTPGQGPDENVLMGVRNLRRIFERISNE